MEFSVVEIGYDRDQVDSCLEDLSEQVTRVVARSEAATGSGDDLARLRQEAERLRDLLATAGPEALGPSYRMRRLLALAEEEAAGILVRARAELAAAQDEAREVRERVYAEAMEARRDFEAALHARRVRAAEVDDILRDVRAVSVPAGSGADEEWDDAAEWDGSVPVATPEQPQSGSPRVSDHSTAQV